MQNIMHVVSCQSVLLVVTTLASAERRDCRTDRRTDRQTDSCFTLYAAAQCNRRNRPALISSSPFNMTHLLLSADAPAARRPQLSIDISCSQGAQQQTRQPSLLLSIGGTDRQTDARPLLIDPDPHTTRTALITESAVN